MHIPALGWNNGALLPLRNVDRALLLMVAVGYAPLVLGINQSLLRIESLLTMITPIPQPGLENYSTLGKIAAHTVEMFTPFKVILKEGYTRDPEEDDKSTVSISSKPVLKLRPTFHDELREGGPDHIKHVYAQMDNGRIQVRTTDIHGVKEKISNWRSWNPSFPTMQRATQAGFAHPECGRLLCPSELNWDDDEVRQNIINGTEPVEADDLCNLCYANERMDPQDKFVGFMRNDLLVSCGLHIWHGPSYANLSGSSRSTRAGNGQKHDITKMTVPAIAYLAGACTFFLFASYSSVWSSNGEFDYRLFYHTLMDIMESMPEDELKDLLEWWDEKIFGDVKRKKSRRDRPAGKESLAVRLKAIAEARKKAKRQPLCDVLNEEPEEAASA
ncbi:uncharacterized protein EV420DRAFT_1639395 [Desarmillaria tabescens]|uniref:Uncharacterized protein n=1 Tax=Armillaria tabescens TaxID=1929756 RepID=A0AA39TYP5_ARMTA|nr:uncharacterized protein EV420DRAFT_1639395 [Desarmillaria tabescens]KAK0463245.1 hypothetical protein EV420DRAFT_1639395 [Desarmillaria tabescens]